MHLGGVVHDAGTAEGKGTFGGARFSCVELGEVQLSVRVNVLIYVFCYACDKGKAKDGGKTFLLAVS
jgi:hypothetical protein